MQLNLYPHQIDALEKTKNHNRVAYYYDCGLSARLLSVLKK